MANTIEAQPEQPKRSIFVGDLHPDVTETDLMDLFGSNSRVESIRLCRDTKTKKSMCYAYVNFMTTADAEEKKELLNYSILKGIPMRIMWTEKDKDKINDKRGNLLIKNLDQTVDARTLYESFKSFGEIKSLKLVTDSLGKSKGFAYINYEDHLVADKVLESVIDVKFKDKLVVVCRFKSRAERGKTDSMVRNNLYVKNFYPQMSVEELTTRFSEFGKITSTFFPKKEITEESIGYGFICFQTVEEAKKALETMNGYKISDNSYIYCSYALKKYERADMLNKLKQERKFRVTLESKGRNMYIKNFGPDVVESELIEYFSKYGSVKNCCIVRDKASETSKKYGYLCFDDEASASKCLSVSEHMFKGQKLYVSLHQTKDERHAQFAKEHYRRQNMEGGVTVNPLQNYNQFGSNMIDPTMQINYQNQKRINAPLQGVNSQMASLNMPYAGYMQYNQLSRQQMLNSKMLNSQMLNSQMLNRPPPPPSAASRQKMGLNIPRAQMLQGNQMYNENFSHGPPVQRMPLPPNRMIQVSAVSNSINQDLKGQVIQSAPKDNVRTEITTEHKNYILSVAKSINEKYASKVTASLYSASHVLNIINDENVLKQEIYKIISQMQQIEEQK